MNPQTQSWLSANIKSLLSVVVIFLIFSYLFTCLVAGIKPDAQVLIGLLNILMLILGYWFGSSSGSSKKDDALVANVSGPATPPTT